MGATRAQAARRAEHATGETLAARVTDLRLAIELAKPLLRMAILRPAVAEEKILQALAHLEGRD